MTTPASQEQRDALRAQRQALFNEYQAQAKPNSVALLHRHTLLIDRHLCLAWEQHGLPNTYSLIAIGGYGRGEMYPYSDVDLLILLPEGEENLPHPALSNLVSRFWDIGLEIGHSVRSISECLIEASKDISVQTALLESRLLAGDRKQHVKLKKVLRQQLNPQQFFRAKELEQRQRYAKYQDTPYSLEPNCKESPGGLRDLQVILWVAKAAQLGKNWAELARKGLLTRAELKELRRTEKQLREIRIALHLQSSRHEDRLVFDIQTAIAQHFGLKPSGSKRVSEVLMQRYYKAAKIVMQLNTLLLQNIEAQLFPIEHANLSPLDTDFAERQGLLEIRQPDLFEHRPAALLEAFRLMQIHGLRGMTTTTLRGIWHAKHRIDRAFRDDRYHRQLFLALLQAEKGIVHELRRMNQLGVLGRYLPPFRRIVGQMQHDLFHVYTVDQHILFVVRNVRRFTMPEHAHEFPFCSQLMAHFDKPWLLYIAALFHDIAKGRGGDHSALGKGDARRFCRAHGLDKADTDLVVFLVEHHLTMSTVAQKQDISDPDIIARFAHCVKTERALTALYLLTVADIRGTSPKVWNAWKAKLLEDLFRLTQRHLGGSPSNIQSAFSERQAEAERILRLNGLSADAHHAFWQQLDVSYFLRHEPADIAWQTRFLYSRFDTLEPIIRARLAPIGEGLQITVYLPDQPDLFARICGYFESRSFSILDAKIYTTKQGYAFDTFLIINRTLAVEYRDIIALVESELQQRLREQTPLHQPIKGRLSRLSRHFPVPANIVLQPDSKGQYHLMDLTATDRPGLLYAIAYTLVQHRVRLRSAKILTLGERVEDSFLLEGDLFSHPKQQIKFEQELLAVLEEAGPGKR
ncbi:[protein-PII] uridylyltransferase [Parvibium lacunae]|uniref:Bifunctional uridylyltransferase/uridylyl-removing enzyme n=1 Tax=Parvibium lacunae TaxID=1888893 RepID=A0A368L798_9BURK|nr:[protein-PII] uridylyltransferase [Parvibium lacunae]RCS59568.1 [protein-PII] uridylyltransferase [Parvibium lacunae]